MALEGRSNERITTAFEKLPTGLMIHVWKREPGPLAETPRQAASGSCWKIGVPS